MNKIEIKIPDNLSPKDEAIIIAKKLTQKALSSGAKNADKLRIGQQIDVQHIQTQITITRESKEPIVQMVQCNVCGCEYQNTTALYYWHNYGGKPTQRAVCSEQCQSNVIEFLGDRAAKTKGKLKKIRYY